LPGAHEITVVEIECRDERRAHTRLLCALAVAESGHGLRILEFSYFSITASILTIPQLGSVDETKGLNSYVSLFELTQSTSCSGSIGRLLLSDEFCQHSQ
jgi:hypothetical protein